MQETPLSNVQALHTHFAPGGEGLEDWGLKVWRRRREVHLKRRELAEMCSTSTQTIGRIEAGVMRPSDTLRHAIARALLTEVSDLFPPLRLSDITEKFFHDEVTA